jgi:hypothetical protein
MHFSRSYDKWWREEVILSVGEHRYTRQRCVADLGCPNFKAAQNLSHALQSIGIDSPKKLAKTTPADLLRLEGVGERTVFVALCVLDSATSEETAASWLHSDERARGGAPAPRARPKPSAKERRRARHPRPGGMPPSEAANAER